jgi:Tfp pilus assembly protein PilN
LINWAGRIDSETAHQPRVIVEIDSDTATLIILQEQKLFFHRSIAFGVRQLLSDPANAAAKFVAELQRSLESFEAEGSNLTIAKAILTGQADRVKGLSSRVQQGLNLPTTIVSAFERCALADPAMARDEAIGQIAVSSLVGLVSGPSQVNLTPSALKLHRAFEDRAKSLVGLGCQVMGVLLLVCCLIMATAHQDERYHAKLLQEFAFVSKRTQQLEGLMEQMALVKQWLLHRGELLDAVEELGQRSPPVIQWDRLTFTQHEQLTLRGVSEDMPKVFDFATALRAIPFCAQVDAKRVTKKKTGDQDLTEFEIVCTLGVTS